MNKFKIIFLFCIVGLILSIIGIYNTTRCDDKRIMKYKIGDVIHTKVYNTNYCIIDIDECNNNYIVHHMYQNKYVQSHYYDNEYDSLLLNKPSQKKIFKLNQKVTLRVNKNKVYIISQIFDNDTYLIKCDPNDIVEVKWYEIDVVI